jgi:hypothetical protein
MAMGVRTVAELPSIVHLNPELLGGPAFVARFLRSPLDIIKFADAIGMNHLAHAAPASKGRRWVGAAVGETSLGAHGHHELGAQTHPWGAAADFALAASRIYLPTQGHTGADLDRRCKYSTVVVFLSTCRIWTASNPWLHYRGAAAKEIQRFCMQANEVLPEYTTRPSPGFVAVSNAIFK